MKAIKIKAPYNLEIIETKIPAVTNPDDVLIKVRMAGICGSDMHIYHGTSPVVTYPRIIGHEIVGEVVGYGSSVTEYVVGDHVIVDPVISCGYCYPCRIGRGNVCDNLLVRGVHIDGGYQEYLVVSRHSIYKFSKELSWEEAVMIEPFTVALQAVSRGDLTQGDIVYITGAGPTGLCILQVVKNIGALCIISDFIDSRLALAKSMGADLVINTSRLDAAEEIFKFTGNAKPSVIIDAVGTTRTFEQAVNLVSNAGRVVILGFTDTPSQICQLDITKNELDIRGSRLHCYKFPQVIELFNNKKINAKAFISHKYHFTEIKKAIEIIDGNTADLYKVVLKFD